MTRRPGEWSSRLRDRWARIERRVQRNSPVVYATYLHRALALWTLIAVPLAIVLLVIPIAKDRPLPPIAIILWALYVAAFLVLLVYGYFVVRRVGTLVGSPLSATRTAGAVLLFGGLLAFTPPAAHQILYQRLDHAFAFSTGTLCREVHELADVVTDCIKASGRTSLSRSEYSRLIFPMHIPPREVDIFERCRSGPRRGFPGSRMKRLIDTCTAHGACHPNSDDAKQLLTVVDPDAEACRSFEDRLVIRDPWMDWRSDHFWQGKEFSVRIHTLEVLAAGGPLPLRLVSFALFASVILLSTLVLARQSQAATVWLRSAFAVILAVGLALVVDTAFSSAYPTISLSITATIFPIDVLYLVCVLCGGFAHVWPRLQRSAMYCGAAALMVTPFALVVVAYTIMPWHGHGEGIGFLHILTGISDYVTFHDRLDPQVIRDKLYPDTDNRHYLNLYLPQFLGLALLLAQAGLLALCGPLMARVRLAPRD